MPGALYFICIPAGYLLLTIYALCNVHVVSWGTREVPRKRTRDEIQKEAQMEEEKKKQKLKKGKGFMAWLGVTSLVADIKEYYMQMIGNSDRAHAQPSKSDQVLLQLQKTLEELPALINNKSSNPIMDPETPIHTEIEGDIITSKKHVMNEKHALVRHDKSADILTHVVSVNQNETKPVRATVVENPLHPRWMTDVSLGDGKIVQLDEKEMRFWKKLIEFYLYPLPPDKAREEKLQHDLIQLRNNSVFGYFMLNLLWLVIIFQLQLLKEQLEGGFFIPIPRADNPEEFERFEPLGFVFLMFFAVILTLQFLAMIVHRWGTFLHVIAITEIRWPWVRHSDPTEDTQGAILLAQQLQRISDIEDNPDYNMDDDAGGEELGNSQIYSRPDHNLFHYSKESKPGKYDRRRSVTRYAHGYRYINPETLSHAFQRRYRRMQRDLGQGHPLEYDRWQHMQANRNHIHYVRRTGDWYF